MNQDKARNFFSAYYEGTLEVGLKQPFETALKSDPTLQADYSAFVETVHELDQLKFEEIEVPSFLSDRIATRLEHVQGQKRNLFPVWSNWFGGVVVGAVAVAAIVFALPIFRGSSTANVAGPSMGSSLDQIQYKYDGSKLELLYQPSGSKTLVVSSAISGKELNRFNLNHERVDSPILNPLMGPALFKIEAIGDHASSIVAVPGSAILKAKQGDGSLQDLALALAGHYHVPIVLEASDLTRRLTWSITATDARSAATQALDSYGFSVDQRPDGLIRIFDR